jgi:hypothetical protein
MCIEAGLVVAMTGQGMEVDYAAHLLELPHAGEVCHGQGRELVSIACHLAAKPGHVICYPVGGFEQRLQPTGNGMSG